MEKIQEITANKMPKPTGVLLGKVGFVKLLDLFELFDPE